MTHIVSKSRKISNFFDDFSILELQQFLLELSFDLHRDEKGSTLSKNVSPPTN